MRLMVPGVEWVMKCVGRGASKEVFQTLLHTYREHCNDAMVLGKLLAAFDGSYYAHGALAMVQLIRLAIPSFYTVVDVYVMYSMVSGVYLCLLPISCWVGFVCQLVGRSLTLCIWS